MVKPEAIQEVKRTCGITSPVLWAHPLLVIFTLTFILGPVFGFGSIMTGSFLASADTLCNDAVFVLLCATIHKSGLSVTRVFGIGFAADMCGTAVGWLCGTILYQSNLSSSTTTIITCIIAVFVITTVLISLRRNDLKQIFKPVYSDDAEMLITSGQDAIEEDGQNVEQSSVGKSDSNAAPVNGEKIVTPWWKIRMESIANQYKLSKRETEVFLLLGKGKDVQTIANELYISYSTARTHVRNIYSKCDVHSRHELQEIIDEGTHREFSHDIKAQSLRHDS